MLCRSFSQVGCFFYIEGEDSDSTDDVTLPDSGSGHERADDADTTITLTRSSDVSAAQGAEDGKSPHRQRVRARASTVAASRGLQVKTDRRRSAAPGLPHSPRPAAVSKPPALSPPSTPQ